MTKIYKDYHQGALDAQYYRGHLVAMMMATDWPAFSEGRAATDILEGGTAISGLFDLEPIRLCYLADGLRCCVAIIPCCWEAGSLIALNPRSGSATLCVSQQLSG